MATLLQRAALTAYPREAVASLTGPAWLAFLDRTGRTTAFTTGPGPWLERVAYDPRSASGLTPEDVGQLARIVRGWLARHRTEEAARPC